jgi:hypothetical protein
MQCNAQCSAVEKWCSGKEEILNKTVYELVDCSVSKSVTYAFIHSVFERVSQLMTDKSEKKERLRGYSEVDRLIKGLKEQRQSVCVLLDIPIPEGDRVDNEWNTVETPPTA